MDILSINYKNENTINELSNKLIEVLKDKNDVIFVCIGTDKCIGDSVAPLLGTLLKEHNVNYPIYGTLDDPYHAVSMQTMYHEIKERHPNSFIVAIDACVGDGKDIGNFIISDEPIKPGLGVGKKLPPIGDLSIKAVIDDNSDVLFSLKSIRLNLIYAMARKLEKAIINTTYYLNQVGTHEQVASF